MTVLGIPATLTNQTYTAPSGTFTLPAAKTACHGVVTVDLSACQLVDGGGTSGLLTVSTDCTALTVIGAGAPAGTGRGPTAPGTYTYTTASVANAFVSVADTTVTTVTFTNFTSNGLGKWIVGQGTDPTSRMVFRGCFGTGMTVGVEVYASIDVDNCTLRGGGANSAPVGLHFFQFQGASPPNTRSLWVSGTSLRCTNSEVTGFVSNAGGGFLQGDAILAESSCQSVFIDNCLLGHNSDSGALDSKANWAQVSNCTIQSDGGRALSQHCMGDGTGPWNGLRSINNQIFINNATLASGGNTECYQAEGVLQAFGDTLTLASGARLAVTSFQDAPGSGAPGSYPRLGYIVVTDVVTPAGAHILGPNAKGDDATHFTTITVVNSQAGSGVVYGSSKAGVPDLSPAVVRTYSPSDLSNLPSGTPAFHSNKPSATQLGDMAGNNGATAQTAEVNRVAADFSNMENLSAQQYASYWHEPNPDQPAATIKAAHGVIMSRVMPTVNAGRGTPIKFGIVFAGNAGISASDGRGIMTNGYSRALIDTWVHPSTDFFGTDIYVLSSNITNSADYSAYSGKPWNIPELGTSVQYNPTDTTDTTNQSNLSHMKAFETANNGLTNRASPVLWFDTNHNVLNTSLVAASAVGATAITVDTIPGKQDAGLWTILSGYQIIIDPHGTHPESVALTSTTTANQGAGNPPPATFSLHVPALQFAHANGAAVWLMPQSLTHWAGLNAGTAPVAGTFGASATAANTTISFTVPTGSTSGQLGYALLSWSANSASTVTLPGGFTIVGPRQTAGANVLSAEVIRFTVGASGSGTGAGDTINLTLSTSTRWAVAGIISSRVLEASNVLTHLDNTATPNPVIPAATPLNGQDTVVAFIATRDATAGNTVVFTPGDPVNWSEDTDRYSTSAQANVGAYLMHRTGGTANVQLSATAINSLIDSVVAASFVLCLTTSGGGTATTGDSVPLADAVAHSGQVQSRNGPDTVPISDATSANIIVGRVPADTVPMADAVTRAPQAITRAAFDTVPVVEAYSGSGTFTRPTADSIPLADAVARSWVASRGLGDSVPLADSVVGVGFNGAGISVPVSSGGGIGNDTAPHCTLPTLVGGEVIFCEVGHNLATGASLTVAPTVNGAAMTLIGSGTKAAQIVCYTYAKVATPADSGAVVTATLSSATGWEMIADAYPGASHVLTDHVYAVLVQSGQATAHVCPTVSVVKTGSWIREVVVDKFSPPSTSMTPATGAIIQRSQAQNVNNATGVLSSGDSNAIVATGTRGGDTWNGTANTDRAVMATIGVAPNAAPNGVGTAADSVPLADAVVRAQGLQSRTTGDGFPAAAVTTRSGVLASRALADAPVVSDATTRGSLSTRVLADAVPLVDALTRGSQLASRVPADTAVGAEQVTRAQGVPARTTADDNTITDVVTRSQLKATTAADAVPISESVVGVKGSFLRTLADSIPVFDAPVRSQKQVRNLSDNLTVTETITRASFNLPYTLGRIRGGTQSVKVPPMTTKVR